MTRPTIILTLRPEPGVDNVDLALKRALKFLLRTCGLKCVGIERVEAKEPA